MKPNLTAVGKIDYIISLVIFFKASLAFHCAHTKHIPNLFMFMCAVELRVSKISFEILEGAQNKNVAPKQKSNFLLQNKILNFLWHVQNCTL